MSQFDEHDTLPPSMDPAVREGIVQPPTDLLGIIKRLGPGLIIAGSIVGSGELIATTKTGAQAGISLLWLVLVGCLIKVFVQIELGRYSISHGETTLAALDRVPGPRLRVNWIVWFWVAMSVTGIGQLGGIVGGVGQALALAVPLRGDYADAIRMPSVGELKRYANRDDVLLSEWDLRLAREHGRALLRGGLFPDSPAPAETGPRSPGSLSEEEEDWIKDVLDSTERQLSQVENPGPVADSSSSQSIPTREDLLDAVVRVMALDEQVGRSGLTGRATDADETTIQQWRDARSSLRDLLTRANNRLIDRADTAALSDDDPLKELAEMPLGQRRRALRGHAVLSEQLADLDHDGRRATEAMVAVVDLIEAESEQEAAAARLARAKRAARSGEIDASVLREAERNAKLAEVRVNYRSSAANVFIEPPTVDDKYWAAVIAVFTAGLLFFGRYGLIQNVSMVLVVGFTFITIGNSIALQTTREFYISPSQLLRGLSFGLPHSGGAGDAVTTALATFGIIGVGASELIAYPYWCLEKGYAKWTGANSPEEGWAGRARGWMRVMHFDAFLSMVVYTIATLAFFVVGVAVLYNEGRDPDGMRMVSTLVQAYVPVFGEYAKWLFLIGAVAVLYSTFMVATAGNARIYTDAFKVFGVLDAHSERRHNRSVGTLSVVLPLLCLTVYCSGINPVQAILIAATMQALLLPMIGVGALYLRYTRTDERLRPKWWWDACLILSCLGLLIAGAWGAYSRFF